jgi:hypothetical protein
MRSRMIHIFAGREIYSDSPDCIIDSTRLMKTEISSESTPATIRNTFCFRVSKITMPWAVGGGRWKERAISPDQRLSAKWDTSGSSAFSDRVHLNSFRNSGESVVAQVWIRPARQSPFRADSIPPSSTANDSHFGGEGDLLRFAGLHH